MNNTSTKFEVWVNIYLADFFLEFSNFLIKKEPFGATIKLENQDYNIKKADPGIVDFEVLLFHIMPYEKEVIKKHK